MVFGHNTNLKLGNLTFHIQTEDRGEAHALIDTTVYYHGRVLHRRTNNYFDLLPMNEDREQALRLRLDEQHHSVIDEIRSGALQLPIPQDAPAPHVAATSGQREPRRLSLDLTNPKSWLAGKHARLQIVVREQDGAPASGTQVRVEFEGTKGAEAVRGQTGANGETLLEFDLPPIISPEAMMVIRAENQNASGYLRYALRAKPRVITG